MGPEHVLEALRAAGAVKSGHFKLSSGAHSDLYVQCALVLEWPAVAAELGTALAAKLAPLEPQVAVGPAMGGVIIAQEVARTLGVRMVFTERSDGAMTLRRGFQVQDGERAVVVEDVVTTGGSPREVVGLLGAAGAHPVGVGSIVN